MSGTDHTRLTIREQGSSPLLRMLMEEAEGGGEGRMWREEEEEEVVQCYRPTRLLRDVRERYGHSIWRYAHATMSGPDTAYGATQCAVPSPRMVLRCARY
eukprot:2292487-Rhodomonas_salina.1